MKLGDYVTIQGIGNNNVHELNTPSKYLREDKVPSRITAIDFVRGIVIILMGLDHASTYWNYNRFFGEFWNAELTILPDFWQFLVRFVSHWCAPTFVFLAGTSLILSEAKRLERGTTQSEITQHLIARGLILLLIEWTLIVLLFEAAPYYFGVLAAIGVGFIVFAFVRKVDTKIIFGISLFIVLDDIFAEFFWSPLIESLNHPIYFSLFNFGEWLQPATHIPSWPEGLYPLDPWLGVLGLGVVFGRWLHKKQQQETLNYNREVAKQLAKLGGVLLGAFLVVRITQGTPTSFQSLWIADGILKENAFAFQNFFFLSKYPPSIVFLLWTLGGMFLALAFAFYLQDNDRFQSWIKPITLFGTTALFFYCTHLMLYGFIPVVFDLRHTFSLEVTMLVWILGLLILFPLCYQFRELKKKYPQSILRYI
jgi:uncharacterized membrane protein